MMIGHGFILLVDGWRCLPRHALRDIDVRHTLRNIAVCPSHTTGLSRCPSHTARYHVCPSHTARYRAWCLTHCAIPRVVPHTLRDTACGASHTVRYCAWCLTHCAIPSVVPHTPPGYLAVCPSHTTRCRDVSVTHSTKSRYLSAS